MQQMLMAIRPEYSKRIFSGEKRFELRRGRVRAAPGDIVWIYEAAPTKAVVGAFEVGRVLYDKLTTIWHEYNLWLGVNEKEYAAYFVDCSQGCAIEIAALLEIEPIPLHVLRQSVPGFRPPQSYQWLGSGILGALPPDALGQMQRLQAIYAETAKR